MEVLLYFVSGVLVLLTYIYFKLIKRDPRVVKYLDRFPGPPTDFLVGNAFQMAIDNSELIPLTEKWYEEYKGSFRIWLGKQGRLMICDASIVEKVLSSNVHINKSTDYNTLHAWLNTGLLTSTGEKWFSRRKLITPTFHFKILDEFLDVFNEQAEVLIEILKEEHCQGKPFNIFPYITRCVLDILSETAMGRKIAAQRSPDSEYVRAIYSMGEIFVKRTLRPWLAEDFIWNLTKSGAEEKKLLKILHGFTDQAIRERKEIRRLNLEQNSGIENGQTKDDDDISMTKKKRMAFLDLLLDMSENGKVLSDSDIREETDTFMFEGHDTTAANLCWTVFCLATNPEYMEKAQEELDDIFGDDRSRPITKEDLARMKYLECCIKESLRIFPSVPLFARYLREDLKLDDGRMVPSGANVVIFTYLLHRDPKYFPNPNSYQPDRFLPENSAGRNPYCYVPFSAGPRNCIGQKFAMMEDKIILAKLLLNFKFEACEKLEEMKIVPDLILRPKNGVIVKLKERA